jgi:hypothetical protein
MKRMDVCQSGFHDQELQKRLVKVHVEGGQNVVLCNFCLSRIMEAQQQGGDLTMTVLYQWAKECGDIPQLPECLSGDCMNRCHLVQFLNQQLLKIRTTNVHFPKILMNPDEKERFIRILQENNDSMKNILNDERSNKERKNIVLRLWTGCLCAAKECRRTSVSAHNPDGTANTESYYTPEMRAESFKKIMITSREDSVYQAGVEVAPVWELILNEASDKKMYLDGIPNLNDSPVTKYLKDRNKIIISAQDIEINK